jgi:hypothetical protein
VLLACVLFQRTRGSKRAGTLIAILRTNSITGGSDFSEFRIIEQAFREAGTEGLPVSVRLLRAHERDWRERLRLFLAKQSLVKLDLGHSASERQLQGELGVAVLGTNAAPAIPEVLSLLRDHRTAGSAAAALLRIGGPAEHAFTNRLAYGSPTEQRALLGALAYPRYPTPAIGGVIPGGFHPGLQDLQYALDASRRLLPRLPQLLRSATPHILNRLQDPRDDLWWKAYDVVEQQTVLRTNPAALELVLGSTNCFARYRAAGWLDACEIESEVGQRALKRALADSDSFVRSAAEDARKRRSSRK